MKLTKQGANRHKPNKKASVPVPGKKAKRIQFRFHLQAISKWLTNKKAAIVISAVGLATYVTGLVSPFWNDDMGQIVNNPLVHSITHVATFFTEGTFFYQDQSPALVGAFYRPLMTTMFALIYTLFGPHTLPFHLLQLALGLWSTFLLYLVFRYSFGALLSLILSLIFLIHPIDSQVIFAIPSLQDTLYFFFGILAFWTLLKYESKKSMILAAASLFLGLLAKETAVLFVFVSLLYLWWFDPRRIKFFASCMAVFLAVYGWLYFHASPFVGVPKDSAPINVSGIGVRLLTAPSTVAFYFGKLFWPHRLATAYYWVVARPTLTGFWLPLGFVVLLISAVILVGWRVRVRASTGEFKTYVFFSIWLFVGLALTSQVFPLDMTACETWFYFDMVGLLGLVGVAFHNLVPMASIPRSRWALTFVLVLVVALGSRTAWRGIDWHDTTRLDYLDIANSPGDYTADDRLAAALAASGNLKAAQAYDIASVRLLPTYYNTQNLAITDGKLGDYQAALRLYKQAFSYDVTEEAMDAAASVFAIHDEPSDAEVELNNGLARYPSDYNLWMDMAVVYSREHETAKVENALNEARFLGPVPKAMAAEMVAGQPFQADYLGKTITIK